MSIDWSKAEAGYDYHIQWEFGPRESHFYRDDGDRYTRQGGFYAMKKDIGTNSGCVITRRPWNGEGLPPVGIVCVLSGPTEALRPIHPEWAGREVKVYSHFVSDKGTEMAAYVDAAHQIGGVGIAAMFLPVRTPEQIAAAERDKAIAEMVDALGCDPEACKVSEFIRCGILYDAGYRRQEAE